MEETKLTLENKIREQLPHLKEVNKGCVINGQEVIYKSREINNIVLIDVFSNDYGHDRWKIKNDIIYRTINKVDYPVEIETISHPIKLNDVLEYMLNFRKYSVEDFEIQEVLNVWDLSSVFLADQSDKLKDFLNTL